MAFGEQTNGPFIAFKSMVAPETYRELSEQTLRLITDLNQADGDGIAVDSAYAQIVARKSVSYA